MDLNTATLGVDIHLDIILHRSFFLFKKILTNEIFWGVRSIDRQINKKSIYRFSLGNHHPKTYHFCKSIIRFSIGIDLSEKIGYNSFFLIER